MTPARVTTAAKAAPYSWILQEDVQDNSALLLWSDIISELIPLLNCVQLGLLLIHRCILSLVYQWTKLAETYGDEQLELAAECYDATSSGHSKPRSVGTLEICETRSLLVERGHPCTKKGRSWTWQPINYERSALQKVRGGTLLIVLCAFTCEFLGRRHGF